MYVRQLTSGAEADGILDELARVLSSHAGVVVRRVDRETLVVEGAEPDTVEQVLGVLSPAWPAHVALGYI